MVAANRLTKYMEPVRPEMEPKPPEVNWLPLWFLLTFLAGLLIGGWD